MKLDFQSGGGTLTSVSAYNKTRRSSPATLIDFRPRATAVFAVHAARHRSESEPVPERASRIARSCASLRRQRRRVRWIGGALLRAHGSLHLDRQHGGSRHGCVSGLRTPSTNRSIRRPHSSRTVRTRTRGRCSATSPSSSPTQLELDTALRYDEDQRENTTETPPAFLNQTLDPNAVTGQNAQAHVERGAAERHVPLQANADTTLYGGWSRGFRSGGFNQTGVGAVATTPYRRSSASGHIRSRGRGHLGSGCEGPVPRPAPECAGERVSHEIAQLVFLRVPRRPTPPRTSATFRR